MLLRAVLMLLAFATLGGCAFGHKLDYRQSTTTTSAHTSKPIAINVIDQRPYVISGDKKPIYVGTLRALYYNPFNINTLTGLPLSSDLAEAIRVSLEHASINAKVVYSNLDAEPGQKLLVLTVREWKSDAYMRIRFDYDITASVIDGAGKELASKSVKSTLQINNYILAGSNALLNVLDDKEIVAALSADPVAAVSVPAPAASAQRQ
ncbi:hypothetical protein M2401_002433 [Pseudomonas sp. JUb42]|jgi:hypothetical protein|uniref:hypothetical protein n=1 Tax=Pseudomonas sp. JUb42 TaxID=2940611 RepID=UPI0021673725|nr:hypothetical protein [Pseudomonas sp. JUb42]MCS3468698.1 hypothetical protein [Pseudomonas sp. JUb42]